MVDIYYQSNIEYKFISKLNTILDLQYEKYKKLIIETILKELHEELHEKLHEELHEELHEKNIKLLKTN